MPIPYPNSFNHLLIRNLKQTSRLLPQLRQSLPLQLNPPLQLPDLPLLLLHRPIHIPQPFQFRECFPYPRLQEARRDGRVFVLQYIAVVVEAAAAINIVVVPGD